MEKTRKIMLGVTTTALTMGLAGCGSSAEELPPKPTDQACNDWDWDDEQGVWVCDDHNSSHRGYYYYGGRYYKNKNALLTSTDYTNYKNSSSFELPPLNSLTSCLKWAIPKNTSVSAGY